MDSSWLLEHELPALAHDLRLDVDERPAAVEEREDRRQASRHGQDGLGEAGGIAEADHLAVLHAGREGVDRAELRGLGPLSHDVTGT